jgi:hypothetical protein
LAEQETRLEVRFGSEHDLTTICRSLAGKVLSVVVYVDEIASASDPAAAVDKSGAPIQRDIVEVGLARQSFTLTAYRAVGVRLPPQQLDEV